MRGPWRSLKKDLLKMETAAGLGTGSCSHLQKEKVEPAFLPDEKQQHNNKNPEEGGMSDVTEPRSRADKGGARGWGAGRRLAKRADSKLFLFKKKKS